ncbi:transmembrane protein, putative [Rhizoctonia solani AG-3 Rhs1AP]|nr:transmembrane protein, putative [Rhizoctonia solani AG-3 Rhs1AP]KEP47002.1 putative transmembrane protein [Rhizoctonia solani 123E]
MPALEYPVTRQYPWRWTTLTVCFCAGFVLVALGLLNFAAVGYNTQSSYYDEFTTSKGVEWKNKLNVGYTQGSSMKCDPSNIVLGGTYRTNNAIFALNVESLRDPVTTAPLGSANYSGDALDNCGVNRIYMMAEYATHEVKYRAQVACRSLSLFVNFTVDSVATIRAGVPNGIVNVDTLGSFDHEQSRPEAVATSVLYALGLDVLASIFFSSPPVPSASSVVNGSATSIWAEWDPLASGTDLPLVLSGMASADGSYLQTTNSSAFDSQNFSFIARAAMRNFAIALHSAILVDLGSTVDLGTNNNILTSPSALQSRIQTDELLSTFMTQTVGSANGLNFSIPVAPLLLSNPKQFRLPIAARQADGANPARLVQRYLCHRLVLKPPATLIVDVLVATMSMFMVGWGLAQIALMYVAKEHSVNGNYLPPGSPKYVNTPGESNMMEYGWTSARDLPR